MKKDWHGESLETTTWIDKLLQGVTTNNGRNRVVEKGAEGVGGWWAAEWGNSFWGGKP